MFVDDDFLYWPDCPASPNGSIIRANKDGSSPTQLGPNIICPSGLVADATTFFFESLTTMVSGQWQLQRVNKDGTGLATLTTLPAFARLAVDDTFVYWSVPWVSSPEVDRMSKLGGTVESIFTTAGVPVLEIGVTSTAVFVGERTYNPDVCTILRLDDADASVATQVATFPGLGQARGLVAVEGPTVYFAAADTSSSATLRATRPPYDASAAIGCGASTFGIAADATDLYWTTSGRESWTASPPSVLRAPKPY
jgi:hypothetical protein